MTLVVTLPAHIGRTDGERAILRGSWAWMGGVALYPGGFPNKAVAVD